ncbi:MAG: CGNR zinc finger domain-containing protein [Candidatus Dormiibacterota bacterium]
MTNRYKPPSTGTQLRARPIPHTVFDHACLDFVNSDLFDHRGGPGRFDRMTTPEWRRWFTDRWGVIAPINPSAGAMERMKAVRSLIRELLEAGAIPSAVQLRGLNRVLAATSYKWRLREVEPNAGRRVFEIKLEAVEAGWDSVLAAVVASFAELVANDSLNRTKRCGNPDCHFIFFDDSGSRTRRWCDPHICGNLVKVRAFRARSRRPSGQAVQARRQPSRRN